MDSKSFAVTEDGVVYHWDVHQWVRLGRISCVMREQTKLGRGVREWWHEQLASDAPSMNLVIPGGSEKPYLATAGPANTATTSEATVGGIPTACAYEQSLPPIEESCELLS